MIRTLVIDDQVQIRELLRHALSSNGYQVVTVPRLDQAVAMLAQGPFDLIVLDLSLPEGNGASLLKQIRQVQNQVPVVVYSGMVTSELEKELRVAGANEVISKDVGVMELVKRVEKVIQASRAPAKSLNGGRPTSVLIVDDEVSVRQLLREFFRKKRLEIFEAENGEQAIELTKAHHPSVVLLDVTMPGMDGLATLRKLLEIEPGLGVVMATGRQDDQTVKQAIASGAYGYVLKPFDLLYLELVVLSRLQIAATVSA